MHAVFVLTAGEEPTYRVIDGRWRNAKPYLTIHRVASDGTVHGVFRAISEYCKARSDDLRIDTHPDNRTMQHLITRNGFVRCGLITVRNGCRIAYQWTKDGTEKTD